MVYRRPWYWFIVVGLIALSASALIIEGARTRVAGNDAQFNAAQQLRLQRVEQRVDGYFSDAEALVRMGTQTFAHIYDDRTLAPWLVRQTFRARRNLDVYGLGIVYAPYRFEKQSKFVCIYERAPSGQPLGRFDTRFNAETIDVRAFGDAKTSFDYTRYIWFQKAVRLRGAAGYSGPYLSEGQSFISAVQAVYRNQPKDAKYDRTSTDPKIGPLFAVVTVDILTSRFDAMLREGLAPGDVVWIRSGISGRKLMQVGTLPADALSRNIVAPPMPLRYTGATLFMSSDARTLRRIDQTVVVGAAALVAVVLGLAALVVLGLLQRWRQIEATRRLQEEQSRLAQEIAVAKTVEGELRKTAFTDTLTGFPNRAAFFEQASVILASTNRAGYSVLLADLDRFNVVNETLGHAAGDELLRALSRRLASRLPDTTFVGRLGGDEFVFISPVRGVECERLAGTIMDLLYEPVVLYGQTLHMQASLGIVSIDESYLTPEELLRDVDIAVYRAKNRGRARFETFDTAMRAEVARDSELESELRRAIDHGEFIPHYQPIIQIDTGEISSFEALVRWQRNGEITTAGDFIPFAEKHGLGHAIDSLMMRAVCSQASALLALFPGSSIAVNVSAAELGSLDLASNVEALLKEFSLPALRLRLEITETAMMAREDEVRATLERLQDIGVAMLLDDFGTGYSSLAHLQRLPIVGLKIDKTFVDNVHTDERARELVRSIVALAEAFGLETTAEGVESEEQLRALRDLGVTLAQGFFFSKALDIGQLASLRAPGALAAQHE